jgi:hypothetical protein
MKSNMEVLQILKIAVPYDRSILFLGVYPKELIPGSPGDVFMFTVAYSQ